MTDNWAPGKPISDVPYPSPCVAQRPDSVIMHQLQLKILAASFKVHADSLDH